MFRIESADLAALSEVIRSDESLHHIASRLVSKYFVGRATAAKDATWMDEITAWLATLIDREDRFLIASSDITWALRQSRCSVLSVLRMPNVMQHMDSEPVLFRTEICVLLQSARYDFNFELIEQLLSAAGRSVTGTSLYFAAMLQFSRMGSGKQIDRAAIEGLLSRTESEKILSLLLHGLWFTSGSDEANLMIRIADRLIQSNPYDPVTLMRQAAAYRRLGLYDEAVTAINRATAILPPNEAEMHGDFKLERVTIAIQKDASERLEKAIADQVHDASTALKVQIDSIVAATRSELSDSMFKVVEILGIFTAIIAVIATVVASAGASGVPWPGRILVVLAGGLVALGFFAVLRWIVRPPASPRRAK